MKNIDPTGFVAGNEEMLTSDNDRLGFEMFGERWPQVKEQLNELVPEQIFTVRRIENRNAR